jgi:integrase
LADDQVRRLLGCLESPIHRACFSLAYACGLRISEARTLQIQAIDSASLTLRIIGKGDKERLVPLPQPVLDALRAMWKTTTTPAGCSPIVSAPGPSLMTCWPGPSPPPLAPPASADG